MYINSVVKRVFLKQMPQPDAYQNTHRVNLEMQDGLWYSLGNTKQSTFGQLKTKQGYLTEGANIEFMFEKNNDWNNITKGSLKILAPGVPPKPEQGQSQPQGQPMQQPAQQVQQQAVSQPQYQQPVQQSQPSRREGVQVGAAMNQAIALVGPGNLNFDLIEQTAERLFLIANKVKEGKVVLASDERGRPTVQNQPAQQAPVQSTPAQPSNPQQASPQGAYDAMDSDFPL